LLDILVADLRYALRTFRRSPGVAAPAVVSLAVGIAAATGLFSIVDAALLHPFPFADSYRIVTLSLIDKGKPRGLSVTARQLVALQQSGVLDGAFASNGWPMTLTGPDVPEAVPTQQISAGGLNVLGVAPLLGRVFNEADGPAGEQPQRVVVLTYRFWLSHFGGRPEAVGKTLYLNRESYTVVGVLPRQYFSTGPEILVPLDLTTKFVWNLQARLRRGVTPRDHRGGRRPPQCWSPPTAGAVDLRALHAHVDRYRECDSADESRSAVDDPIDSGGGAYRRSLSASGRGAHGGRRAGGRGLGA